MKPKLPRKVKKAFKKSFARFDIISAALYKNEHIIVKGYKASLLAKTGYAWKLEKGEFIKMHPNEIYGCMKKIQK